nr:recombinase family protein [Streptomyces sp. CB02400]
MALMNAQKGTPDQVRAVVYIRQSKRREGDSRTSPEAQHVKCDALIAAKGWHHAGTFADIGVSGWDPDVIRPEFEAMMEAARNGEIDAVVVFMLSRLTRRGAMEAMHIQEELSKYGVLLVSVEEPYLDTSTSMGISIFGLIAALAQQESDMKSAYVTATKETLRKAGSHVSGMAPYGFTTERVSREGLSIVQLVPDDDEAPVVRRMVEDAVNGTSASAIATKLTQEGEPTKTDRLGDTGKNRLKARHARGMSKPLERTPWHSTTVFRVLRDPRLATRRVRDHRPGPEGRDPVRRRRTAHGTQADHPGGNVVGAPRRPQRPVDRSPAREAIRPNTAGRAAHPAVRRVRGEHGRRRPQREAVLPVPPPAWCGRRARRAGGLPGRGRRHRGSPRVDATLRAGPGRPGGQPPTH